MDDFTKGIDATNYEILPCMVHKKTPSAQLDFSGFGSSSPSIWGVGGPLKGIKEFALIKPLKGNN
jgi:hypothetical protein